jgi:protein phosphatase
MGLPRAAALADPGGSNAQRPRADGIALSEWPRDALVLLIGPSGCGKSTWAADRFRAEEILSSDAFRAMVAGDATDQTASADAFRLLHQALRARLRRGLRTVVDATNLTPGARRSLRRMADQAARPTIAVVFEASLALCLARNAARPGRHVPEAVVIRQHQQLRVALDALGDEGYLAVRVVGAAKDGDARGVGASDADARDAAARYDGDMPLPGTPRAP